MRKVILKASFSVHFILAALCFPGGSTTAHAEEAPLHNQPFSFFGVGNEFISYHEQINSASKLKVSFNNPVQRSGGYIPLFQNHGLYMLSSSTLKSTTSGEKWNVDGIGTIQENDSKISWNELTLAVAHHFKPGHQVTFGADYYTMKFTRFNFRSGDGTDTYNTTVNHQPTYDQWTANPATKDKIYPGLRPENNLTTVIEDFSCLTAMVGYRYDTFFVQSESPWRLAVGVRAGLPLYYQVENSQLPNDTFIGSVNKGYDFGADAELGWKYSKHFSAVVRADYNYKFRNALIEVHPVLTSMIPENTVNSLQSTVALLWAF